LAQQVMLLVIERLRANEVHDPDQIGSFILGACRMTITGGRRTERRREQLHVRFDARDLASHPAHDDTLDAARLAPCLAALRERERTVVLLSFYSERTADDIGRSLGMTAGAVRVSRHRALGALRTCLDTRRGA
jgi:RNA polymerase sigma-70 factor (ECF subfamily)